MFAPPTAIIHTIAQAAIGLQDRPVELTLHPQDLGRVRLTMQAGDGSMAVIISVERPETLDLLRRHIDQLASQLRELGYQKLTFEFAGQGQQFGGDQSSDLLGDQPDKAGNQQQDDAAPAPAVPAQNPEPLRLTVGSDAGLDIRL